MLTLLALLAWQGVVNVPASGAVVFGVGGLAPGGGRRWLPPWPLEPPVAVPGIPFETRADALTTREPSARQGLLAEQRRIDLMTAHRVEASGTRVRVDGARFLVLPVPDHARLIAERVTEAVETEPEARGALARSWLDASLDAGAARSSWSDLRRTTRLLRWTCTAQLLVLGLALPLAVVIQGAGEAVLTLLPAIGGLHVLGLAGLLVAARRLPAPRGGRFEILGVAALYPPALIHAPAELAARQLAPFHPLAVAAVRLSERRWRPALRLALARAAAGSRGPEAEVHEAALLRFAAALGVAESELRAPPRPASGFEVRYCPVCHDPFRLGADHCPDCDVPTQPLPGT